MPNDNLHSPMSTLRVATYNIHKGVQGLGPARRLEIHNIGHAIEQLDADVVCLQEVRKGHRKEEKYFKRWPQLPQADFLAPEGYEAIYKTNAVTSHGEHGNALLSRWPVVMHQHEDMSDHRLEQRGLLHVEVLVQERPVHVIVVHLGLIRSSRERQLVQLVLQAFAFIGYLLALGFVEGVGCVFQIGQATGGTDQGQAGIVSTGGQAVE